MKTTCEKTPTSDRLNRQKFLNGYCKHIHELKEMMTKVKKKRTMSHQIENIKKIEILKRTNGNFKVEKL